MPNSDTSILIIYTGGTIGMVRDSETDSLKPFNFSNILQHIPELKKFGFQIHTIAFDPPIDSADVNTDFWLKLASMIETNYQIYDGFVVLHGTDTMAYTASALSFLLENLQKPVIFTGSQLPLGALRTDGKENLLTSIEIAAEKRNGYAVVPEVCIYFENKLFRANRTTKYSAEHFNAFRSVNYPVLAEVGIHIHYNYGAIDYPTYEKPLKVYKNIDHRIGILKIFPSIMPSFVEPILNLPELRGLILETYGSGNAMTDKWFINSLKKTIDRGVIIVNVSQCFGGSVNMDLYRTGIKLKEIGVLSGYDTTTEAMLTKLMFLFGNYSNHLQIQELLNRSLRGEITIFQEVPNG